MQQVNGLNIIRAFPYREDFDVACVLFQRIVAQIADASVNLNRQLANPPGLIRHISLRQRRQQVDKLSLPGDLIVPAAQRRRFNDGLIPGEPKNQRAHSLDFGLHFHEHPTDVDVFNDRHPCRTWIDGLT
jgi:hypothetical protein